MATNILLKRGINSSFPTVTLKSGEPAFLIDTGKLYVGDGIKKVLINPVDKPVGINTSNFYAKTKVNEYGQVVSQSALSAQDIPTIASSQVSGLGSAAVASIGTAAGNVPVLDGTARLNDTVMPLSVIGSGAMAYFTSATTTVVSANQYVPLNGLLLTNSIYSLDANGLISINQPGIYLVSYSISSTSLQLHTSLGPGNTNSWIGSFARSATTAVTPYTSTSATIMRQITAVPEKYGIKNLGPSDITLINGYINISVFKIG